MRIAGSPIGEWSAFNFGGARVPTPADLLLFQQGSLGIALDLRGRFLAVAVIADTNKHLVLFAGDEVDEQGSMPTVRKGRRPQGVQPAGRVPDPARGVMRGAAAGQRARPPFKDTTEE